MTPEETIAAIRADARFAAASEKLAADHARMVEDCITLTQIPCCLYVSIWFIFFLYFQVIYFVRLIF